MQSTIKEWPPADTQRIQLLQADDTLSKYYALVDAEYYDWLKNNWVWYCFEGKRCRYAIRRPDAGEISKGIRRVFMHRQIMELDIEKWHADNFCKDVGLPEVDHWDRDGLHNFYQNLRVCTRDQNQANRGLTDDDQCGFKGVYAYWQRGEPIYKARLWMNGRLCDLPGSWNAPELAAQIYDAAAVEYYAEFACTNQDLGLL